MAKWAIHDDNGNVTDTFTVDPKKILHPDLAKHYVSVANAVEIGQVKGGDGKYTTPAAPAAPDPGIVKREINKGDFLALCTAAERKALKAAESTDDTVDDFMEMFAYGPHDLAAADVKTDIDYFVTKSFIGAATKTKIDAYGA